MSKIHYFQRYSSPENTVTNNTLQLVARIYDYSPSRASKLLADITGEEIEIGLEINQQQKAQSSVPDGAIIQRSFKILIESKVDSSVSSDQLARHAKAFSDESQKILLLLTRREIGDEQKKAISELLDGTKVVFRNVTYEAICTALKDLFAEHESEMKALADDYIEYCNDTGLFDQSPHLMRIVPCGTSLGINKKYGIYFHPSDRGYTKHQFEGIYSNKAVRYMWEIDSVFDVTLEGGRLRKKLVEGRDTDEYDDKLRGITEDARTHCSYNVETGHRFFCGRQVAETDYRKVSSGGIQGARFVNLRNVVGDFQDVTDVARKLRSETWE